MDTDDEKERVYVGVADLFAPLPHIAWPPRNGRIVHLEGTHLDEDEAEDAHYVRRLRPPRRPLPQLEERVISVPEPGPPLPVILELLGNR